MRASDGAVIDTPFLVSLVNHGPYQLPQQQSAVAYDAASGTYLVAWYSYFYEGGPVSTGIRGIRIRASDRHIIGWGSTLLGRGGADPRVASAQGYFLVAWTRNVGGTQGNNIEAARMDAYLGTVMDHTPISLAATDANENSPAVASHGGENAAGGEFMVIWTGANNALVGRRLRARDGFIITPTEFTVGTSAIPNVPAELIFDGQSYQAAWQGTRLGARMALATRISTSGEVNSDDELVLSHVPSSAVLSRGGIAATAAGRFVVTYVQYTPEALQRARMRLVMDPPQVPCDSGEPTLVLTGGAENTLECGSGAYSDPGARAFDGCGNPIPVHAYNTGSDASGPGPNMRSEGSYTVSYSAWDAQGRTVNASRTVNVDDRTAPALTLVGPAFMTHTCGSQWQDPGIQALDACYGDISTWKWHSGEVNGWAEGTYTVTYFVTDGGGNTSAPVTRTVEVVDCPW